MTYETIFAGFGGQGILFAGKVIAYAGMLEGKMYPIFLPMVLRCEAALPTAAL